MVKMIVLREKMKMTVPQDQELDLDQEWDLVMVRNYGIFSKYRHNSMYSCVYIYVSIFTTICRVRVETE